MTKDRRTTPKVIVSRVVLNSLAAVDGIDAINATDIAPLIPPSMTTCLHITGIFSLVSLLVAASIGYVDTALATNTATNDRATEGIFSAILKIFMLIPRYKKAAEFAKNAVISQKLKTAVRTFKLISASFFTVAFPKYRPATATATNPEKPKEFAKTTEPNTVAIVSAVSEKGSFINE